MRTGGARQALGTYHGGLTTVSFSVVAHRLAVPLNPALVPIAICKFASEGVRNESSGIGGVTGLGVAPLWAPRAQQVAGQRDTETADRSSLQEGSG